MAWAHASVCFSTVAGGHHIISRLVKPVDI